MVKSLISRALLGFAALSLIGAPAVAQIRAVDPNEAIDADLAPLDQQEAAPASDDTTPSIDAVEAETPPAPVTESPPPPTQAGPPASATAASDVTFDRGDLIGAAEGVFGKGAEGLAGLVERILKEQGEPTAYITGQEASGAFVVGLRYGSGTLHHKIEGNRKVYWTGPSIGFDFGGNAARSFVLVYNLNDSQDLYKRFPAGEGAAYFVGGFTASYMRWGDIVLIPVRLGAGVRLGANVGYMKFSEKGRWLPF